MVKNDFKNLFDYLRRTDSHLVISALVFEEVIAQYRETLKGSVAKATTAWADVRDLQFSPAQEPDFPNLDNESAILKTKLKAPAKGIKIILFSDYSRIDIKEVIRRGVHRYRPASGSGEQLRDVILWLHALDYAKQNRRSVAFISNDLLFSDRKEQSGRKTRQQHVKESAEDIGDIFNIHPHLEEEVSKEGVTLKFYRFLSHFVRENTLRSISVTENWLKERYAIEPVQENLEKQISAMLIAREGYAERILEAHIARMEFRKGIVHEISDTSQFAEIEFELQLRLLVESTTSTNLLSVVSEYHVHNFLSKTSDAGFAKVFNVEPESNPVIWGPHGKQQRSATLKASVLVSIRVEAGAAGNLEIESFAFHESDDPVLTPVYTFANISSDFFRK